MNPILKFLHLSSQKQRCLIVMTLVLHIVRFGLWRLPFQHLWQRIQNSTHPPQWVRMLLGTPPPLSMMVWALDAASWYTPKRAKCLSRAFTLYLLMRWLGYTPVLQIGVAKPSSAASPLRLQSNIEAHAWIEYDGEVILGQITNLSSFVPLPSIVEASN